MDAKKQELVLLSHIEELFKKSEMSGMVDGFNGYNGGDYENGIRRGGEPMIHYYAGLLNTEDSIRFMRTVYRITKGNILIHDTAITMDSASQTDLNPNFYKNNMFIDKRTKKPVVKTLVFLVLMGESNGLIHTRIRSMFEAYNAFTTPLDPSNTNDLMVRKQKTYEELHDLKQVAVESIKKIVEYVKTELELGKVTNVSKIDESLLNIHRQKNIYRAKLFMYPTSTDPKNTLLEGKIWVPERAKAQLFNELEQLAIGKGGDFVPPVLKEIETKLKKPTSFFETDLSMPFN